MRRTERSTCEAHGVMIPQAADGKIKAAACGRKARGQHRETEEKGQRTEHLEKKYGQPYGRLYLACCDGQAAGCVGLKPLTKEERGTNGELKRLYVRPEFRGNRLGSLLMSRILEDAGEIGYRHIYLDTLPFLQSAVYLYRKFGFYEIEKYNNSPVESTIYMRLDL